MKSVLRSVLIFGLLAYLIHRVSVIGWARVFDALPSSPLFYLLSIVFVLLPILSERLAFHWVSPTQTAPRCRVFIRKHVMNKGIMNYAGEGYFITQIRKLDGLDWQSATIVVKNLTLLRTYAANIWVILLVLLAAMLGNTDPLLRVIQVSPVLAVITIGGTFAVIIGGVVFFRKLTRLEVSVATKTVLIYLARSVLAGGILGAQWNLALPGTSLVVWFLFLAVYFVAKKSPVGGDLIFIGVALTLPGLEQDEAAIAAMLIAMTAFLQLIYLFGFAVTSDFGFANVRHRQKPVVEFSH